MVLTADVRDVIFQRDLFKLLDSSKPFLGIALEDGTIAEAPKYDAQWVINAYGSDIYQEIKDNTIICVGTVWGTEAEFKEYSRVMSDILNSEWSTSRQVVEQGVGNYIIYHDKMFADRLQPSTNQDGCIMTLALTQDKDVHIDAQGFVLNGRGEIASVVHQYDRKPEIRKFAAKKYSQGMTYFAKVGLKYYRDVVGFGARFLSKIQHQGLLKAVRVTISHIKYHI